MGFLLPLMESADMVFVLLLELFAIYMKEMAYQTAADRMVI